MLGGRVSDEGVRVRSLLRTARFSWDAVLAVRSQRITVAGGDPSVIRAVRQVCFDLTDGQTIQTPIHGMRPGESRIVRLPAILSASRFDRVLAELRQLTSAHRTRTSMEDNRR